jgi:hypothetical protein
MHLRRCAIPALAALSLLAAYGPEVVDPDGRAAATAERAADAAIATPSTPG